mmetsp:Transcript_30426/g.64416  ORF Transcript_30426/g.64416 Transcript_30426/m.64416 type:complete len:622 (+) Transcript_30426:40-1905(+)|eukprot:CAMPEP_0172305078 /NCGR_PEP_ID=MMETSP1058-20130122/6411_1 /TAXON_ID=83371 /ORGANISM="Detonula confervacea, Strain CCMP 353" /LENGTH=621 /DNA_ID=CAMNT_0013016541 /DNA_START=521 /DNA_END=2386 /DNA_ORIENTATION=-
MNSSTQPSPSSESPILPPLSTLPASTYPPSAYPPISYFESISVIHPALIIPAKRTGEIQKALDELLFSEPKRKRVYPLEEGVDYTADDLLEKQHQCYNPKKERKLVLTTLGHDESEGSEGDVRTGAEKDRVWQEPRVQSLLQSAIKYDSTTITAATAPPGKSSVRPSGIRLSATPYPLLTVDQVLRRIMPADIAEVPSSFEIAGHIAHVNLRDESLPYKYLIGRAILDKNRPKIKMVVNKIGNIENEFRTFPMEVLSGEGLEEEKLKLVEGLCSSGGAVAGEDGAEDKTEEASSQSVQVKIGPQHQKLMEVEVKEHGCRFHLDFARVYFNSRLQGEHDRLVQEIVQDARKVAATATDDEKKKGCIVADAMGGVGPFAVPLTSANAPHYHKTKVTCYANDLNPVSYEYLKKNAKLNRCFSDRLMMYNLDAREFIHKMNEEKVDVDHFIMNLPQLAPEFLDAFRGWKFHSDDNDTSATPVTASTEKRKRPMIHVHCFDEKARTPKEIIRVERQVQQRCETALGCPDCLSPASCAENEFRVHVVRDVGPRKNMLCVSFRLPLEVEGVEKLKLAVVEDGGVGSSTSTGGDDTAASGECNGKRDRVQEGDIVEGTQSNSSKRSKES